MEVDRQSNRPASRDGTESGAQTPGRRSLAEDLAAPPAQGPSNQPRTASQDAAPAPGETSSGPRPTLQSLFRRRDIVADDAITPASAARDDDQAASDERSPGEALAALGEETRKEHDKRIADETEQITTTNQTVKLPRASVGKAPRDPRPQLGGVAGDTALRKALEDAGFPFAAPETLDLTARITDGPFFNDNEIAAVQQASKTAHGRVWLQVAGLFSLEEARKYLAAKQYQGWLKLTSANRLLLAALAWKWQLKSFPPTPAYSLARHMVLKLTGDDVPEDRQQIEDARDTDIRQTWVNTLADTDLGDPAKQAIANGGVTTLPEGRRGAAAEELGMFRPKPRTNANQIADENAKAVEIVKRVFLVLQAGLKVYRDEAKDHVDFREGDVARALAHGGRVNIHIPPLTAGQTGEELPEWLGIRSGGRPSGNHITKRGFGTHDVKVTKGSDGNEQMIERGGAGANLKHVFNKDVYGMNPAVGGLGNRDYNGDVILPDGAHGHMFISFIAPTAQLGGSLQIGMETTAPGAPSTVGYAHTSGSSEDTANPESSSSGHKSDKIGEGKPAKLDLLGRYKAPVTDPKATVPQYVNLAEISLAQINGGQWKDYVEELRTGWLEPMLEGRDAHAKRPVFEKLVGPRGLPLYADSPDQAAGGERKIVDYELREQLTLGEVDDHDPRWTRVTVKGARDPLWARTQDLSSSATTQEPSSSG